MAGNLLPLRGDSVIKPDPVFPDSMRPLLPPSLLLLLCMCTRD